MISVIFLIGNSTSKQSSNYQIACMRQMFYKYYIQMGKEYRVEDVLKKREFDGQVYYRIKWKGYSSRANSWQPETNLNKDIIALWEEGEEVKRQARERKERIVRAKRANDDRKERYWWHQVEIVNHYYNKLELQFEILMENKLSNVSHREMLKRSPRILANYYIKLAKKQRLY